MKNITVTTGIALLMIMVSCDKKDTTAPEEVIEDANIIGKIVDKASNAGIASASVKIVNDGDSYITTTGANGYFEFRDITSGTYKLISEVNQGGAALIDTVGLFCTDSTDWGNILSALFVSISGTITIEGETDHSFIRVLLLGTGHSALTDNAGNFRFDFVLPGQFDLFATNDDLDFNEYRVNNIVLEAGDAFVVDTTLTFLFSPLYLSTTPALFPISYGYGGGGFAYVDGIFYYGEHYGVRAYNPETQLDSLVYNHYFLGEPYIASDFSDGLWLAMDTPEHWIWRRYSTTENMVTDSISNQEFPVQNFAMAWDPTSDRLFASGWSPDGPAALSIYTPATGSVETQLVPLIYDPDTYTRIDIRNIFIDPEGKLYLNIHYQNSDGWQNHLYICSNTTDFAFEKVYRVMSPWNVSNKICWYEGRLLSIPPGANIPNFNEFILD